MPCPRVPPAPVQRDGVLHALPRELRDGIYAAKRKPEKYRGAHQAAISWLAQNRSQTRRPIVQQVNPDPGDLS